MEFEEAQASKIELTTSADSTSLETPQNASLTVVDVETPELQPIEQEVASAKISIAQPWKIRKPAAEKNTNKKPLPTTLPEDPHSYAGFWRRLAAHLIDWTVVSLIGMMLVLVLSLLPVIVVENRPNVEQWLTILFFGFFEYAVNSFVPLVVAWISPLMLRTIHGSWPLVAWPLYLALFFGPIVVDALYRSLMESSSAQATLGKKALRIYVTNQDGGRLKFKQALARHLSKLISGICFMIGYLVVIVDRRKRSFHDRIAKTFVVKLPDRNVTNCSDQHS